MRAGGPGLRRLAAALLLAAGAAGCRTAHAYLDPAGPRYALPAPPRAAPPPGQPMALRVVSFNVKHALRVDRARDLLQGHPALRDADVVLLQEMDAPSTRSLADALGMGFVYYPASHHPATGRDFGNAILSRWPLDDDAKVLLPHRAPVGGTRRAATAATVRIGERAVRVYSVHLGTPVNVGPLRQRNQLRAVLDDAEGWERVILGGDLNSGSMGRLVQERGFLWPTREGPRTIVWGRIDHIFVRGLTAREDSAGTVLDNLDSSDHRPVWAVAVLPEG